jgi:hypothetical protein
MIIIIDFIYAAYIVQTSNRGRVPSRDQPINAKREQQVLADNLINANNPAL